MSLNTINFNQFGDANQYNIAKTEIVEIDHGLDYQKTIQHNQLEFESVKQNVIDNSLLPVFKNFNNYLISTSKLNPWTANNVIKLKVLKKQMSFSNTNMKIIINKKNPIGDSYDGYGVEATSVIEPDYHWDFEEHGVTWKTHWDYGKIIDDVSFYDKNNNIWYHYLVNNNDNDVEISLQMFDENLVTFSETFSFTAGEGKYIPFKDVFIYDKDVLKNEYEVGSIGTISTSYTDKLNIEVDNSFGNTIAEAVIESSEEFYLTSSKFALSASATASAHINESDWVFNYQHDFVTSVTSASLNFHVPVISSLTSNPFTDLNLKLFYKETVGSNDSFDWKLNNNSSFSVNTYGVENKLNQIDVLINGDPTISHNVYVNNVVDNAIITGVEINRQRVADYDNIIVKTLEEENNEFSNILGFSHTSTDDHRYVSNRKWLRTEEEAVTSSSRLVNQTSPPNSNLHFVVGTSDDLVVEYTLTDIAKKFPLVKFEYTFGINGMSADNDWYFRYYRGNQYKQIDHLRVGGDIVSVLQQVDLRNCDKFTFTGLGESSNIKEFYCVSFITPELLYSNFNPVGNKLDFYSIVDPGGDNPEDEKQNFPLGKKKLRFLIKSFVRNDISLNV